MVHPGNRGTQHLHPPGVAQRGPSLRPRHSVGGFVLPGALLPVGGVATPRPRAGVFSCSNVIAPVLGDAAMRFCSNFSMSPFVTWGLRLPLWVGEILSPDVTPAFLLLKHNHGSEGIENSVAGANIQSFSGALHDPHCQSWMAGGQKASRKLLWELSSLTYFQNLPSHFTGFHFPLNSLNA